MTNDAPIALHSGNMFGNWWFAAHMIDLLDSRKLIPQDNIHINLRQVWVPHNPATAIHTVSKEAAVAVAAAAAVLRLQSARTWC